MPRNYVDNQMNRSLGRVGLPVGTAVHSHNSSYGGGSSSSSSGSHRTYVDNSMNRRLDRVGMEHGTAVHSRSDRSLGSPVTHMSVFDSHGLGFMTPLSRSSQDTSSSSSSGSHRTYVDNSMNRRLDRVGMEHGTAVHSSRTPEQKVYVDNHKHNRVGITQESAAASNKKVYRDTPFNRKLGRVGKPLGSHVVSKKKLAILCNHFDEHSNEEIPVGLNNLSQDVISYVFEFMQREKEIQQLVKETAISFWQCENQTDFPGHTRCDEQPYTTYQDSSHSAEQPYTTYEDNSSTTEQPYTTYEDNSSTTEQPYTTHHGNYSSESSGQANAQTVTKLIKTIKCKEIDFIKLQIRKKIGHGGFGEVFLATYNGFVVAVKKLKSQQVTKRRLHAFINEMAVLQELNHPNIISFVGACTVIPNLAIVMEYMDKSLFDAIQIKAEDFTDADKLEIMRGVTIGMAYLHGKNIAHCDLKTKNVLLKNVSALSETEGKGPIRVKITDFGLSKMKSDMTTTTSCPSANIGTPLYAAPEILRGEILTLDGLKQADMYSLGLLLWELAVEDIPFEDFTYEQLKLQVGMKGVTPVFPENIRLNGKLHEFIFLCWSRDPNKRPSAERMTEVASTLTSLLEEGEE